MPSTTTVAVPGHLLRGEQQDRQGPTDRLRDRLDGPREQWAETHPAARRSPPAQCSGVCTSKPPAKTRTGPGSADTPRPPPRAARRAARRTHHQWPVVHSITVAHSFRGHGCCLSDAHDAPRGRAIIISPPGNDPGYTQNNLPGRSNIKSWRIHPHRLPPPPAHTRADHHRHPLALRLQNHLLKTFKESN